MTRSMVEIALDIAAAAHAGQTDKAGGPYIDHCRRVAERVRGLLAEPSAPPLDAAERADIEAAALLHDVLEDTATTEAELRAAGISARAVAIVHRLTHPQSVPYQPWIESIAASGDVGAILVKLADNADNADQTRLGRLPEAEAERLRRKYAEARATLLRGLARR